MSRVASSAVTVGRCAALLLVVLAGCATTPPPPDPAAVALATAEEGFAADARARGTNAAFLAVIADKATLFRPGPVDAKTFLTAHRDDLDLAWRPQLVAVSSAGDLGVSTGPWRLGAPAGGEPGYGQFVTVWRKAADGRWRLVVDHGIDHPGAVGWDTTLETLAADGSRPIEPMSDAEARFAAMSANVGLGAAYVDFASPSMRALREGEAPFVALKREGRIAASVFADNGLWTWTMTDSGTAKSADLGWIVGRYRATQADGTHAAGWYLRVWRSEGRSWRIVADVLAPAASEPR